MRAEPDLGQGGQLPRGLLNRGGGGGEGRGGGHPHMFCHLLFFGILG